MINKDILGEKFQKSLNREERKLLGQFYTPEEIVDYIVNRIEIDENKKIIDLSCGSGRFLLKTYDRLHEIYQEKDHPEHKIHKAILKNNLYGIDINPVAVRITEMNLILKGREFYSGRLNINEGNALIQSEEPEEIGLFKNNKFHNSINSFKTDINLKKNQFDVVIGNPPYLSYGLKGTAKIEKDWQKYLKKQYPYSAQYKISIYALFIERGIQLLKNGGYLGYVLPDSFLLGRFFSNLRKHILDKCRIKELVLFGKDFWRSGLVGKPVVIILQKEKYKSERENNYLKASYFKNLRTLNTKDYQFYTYKQHYFRNIKHNRFRLFFDKAQREKVKKCESAEYRLKDIITFSSGLIAKEGQDTIKSDKKHNNNWFPGLHSSSEINRYNINNKGGYISFEREKLKSGFKKARYFEPKIFLRQTGDSLTAAYDENNLLCLNNLHVGNAISYRFNILYILALLNSKLINEYYQLISLESGRALAQLDIETIEEIPVKYTNEKNQKTITGMVSKIIILKNKQIKGAKARFRKKINNIETQIENKITEIYGFKIKA